MCTLMLCANNTMHLHWSWMPVYTLQYFWKHSEYNEVVWWLLLLLDKMITEEEELRDSSSQLNG